MQFIRMLQNQEDKWMHCPTPFLTSNIIQIILNLSLTMLAQIFPATISKLSIHLYIMYIYIFATVYWLP